MQMLHSDSINLLAMLQGELSRAERAALTSHLSECQDCRDALQEVRSTVSMVTSAPVPVATDALLARILASRAAGVRVISRSAPRDLRNSPNSIPGNSGNIGLRGFDLRDSADADGDDVEVQRSPLFSRRTLALAATLAAVTLAAFQSRRIDHAANSQGFGATSTITTVPDDGFDAAELTDALLPWTSVAHAQLPDDNSRFPVERGFDVSDLKPARWSYVGYSVKDGKTGAPQFTRVVSLERATFQGRNVWQAVSSSIYSRGVTLDSLLFDNEDLRPIVLASRTGSISHIKFRQEFNTPTPGEMRTVRTRFAVKASPSTRVDTFRMAINEAGLLIVDATQLQLVFRVKPLHAKWRLTHGGMRYGQTPSSLSKRTLRVVGSESIRMSWGKIPVWRVNASAKGDQFYVSKQSGDIVRIVSGEFQTGTRHYLDLQVAP